MSNMVVSKSEIVLFVKNKDGSLIYTPKFLAYAHGELQVFLGGINVERETMENDSNGLRLTFGLSFEVKEEYAELWAKKVAENFRHYLSNNDEIEIEITSKSLN